MGFLGQLFGNLSQANSYKAQASDVRWQGRLKNAQLNAQAAQTEDEGKSAWIIGTENQKRMSQNKTYAQAAARNEQAASGFTAEGSGGMAELSVAEQMEQMIADAATGNAIAEANARDEARVMRGQGKLEMMAAEAQAQQYELLAKNAKKAALVQGITGLVGGVIGGLSGGLGGMMQGFEIGGGLGGYFTQMMPGTVAASESTNANFGTNLSELWKNLGGKSFWETSAKNPSFY